MSNLELDALVAAILHQQPLQRLLKGGVDPTARDHAGFTPMYHAVLAGNADAVDALLDHATKRTRPLRKPGGDPSQEPGSPWDLVTAPGPPLTRASPLHLAAERNEQLLRLILGYSSLTSIGASFLGITISSRPQPELLQLRDARGWALLHYAVSRANIGTLRFLLQHMGGAVGDGESSSSSNSSSRSSSVGGSRGMRATNVAYSIGNGVGVNAPDGIGRTALHQAALLGQAECCRLLLKGGADQAAISALPEGALPLHLAAAGNHTAVVDVLFRHAVAQHGFRSAQAVLLHANTAGMTALHVAALQGAVDAARRLLHLVFPFDTRGPMGRTALHLAALQSSTPMITMLLGHSTPQQRQLCDAEGFTALHIAAATGRLDALRVLVAGGCNVDARATACPASPTGCVGWTPLHCAVRRGNVAAIELLIGELGADPHARDDSGRTPCDLAVVVASDKARQGSSVAGTGSGQQPLDDSAWNPMDAQALESSEGGGSANHSKPLSTDLGAPWDATDALPLQGPTVGLVAGAIPAGKLGEMEALEVLQTFVRLLHEPLRQPSSLQGAGTLGSALGSSGMSPTAAEGAACAAGAALGLRNRTEGVSEVPGPSVLDGTICAKRSKQPGLMRMAGEAMESADSDEAKRPNGGERTGIKEPDSSSQLQRVPVDGGGTHAGGGVHIKGVCEPIEKSSGFPFARDAKRDRPQNGHQTTSAAKEALRDQRTDSSSSSRSSGGRFKGGAEVPVVALAFAAQMLAGPPAKVTRPSPFSRPGAQRTSPFKPPSALAGAKVHPKEPAVLHPSNSAAPNATPATEPSVPSALATTTKPSPFGATARPSPLPQTPQPQLHLPTSSAAHLNPTHAHAASAPLYTLPEVLVANDAAGAGPTQQMLHPVAELPVDAPVLGLQATAFTAAATGAPDLSASPPSDGPCLHVVSPINNPCGYSALNRAILLQRHALAEALLATLPPAGQAGSTVVMTGTAPGVARATSGKLLQQALQASRAGTAVSHGVVPLSSALSRSISPGHSQQQLVPLTSSSDNPETGSKGAAGKPGARQNSAVSMLPPLAPSARPLTPLRQPSHQRLMQLRQLSGVLTPAANSQGAPSADTSQGPRESANPLFLALAPLRGPNGTMHGFAPGPVHGSNLFPGLIPWEEAAEVFRTQASNHTSRVWLHWPGELDAGTGWLLAEMAVLEAGLAGGHVWLGLGPPPDALPASSNSTDGGPSIAAPSASGLPSGPASGALARAATGGVPGSVLTPAAPVGGSPGPGGPGGATVAVCPIINHPNTHVVCIRDGQAFRGGVLAPDLGGAARLEARSGDIVALFWNLRGRNATFTLNGRYCGRLTGLPAPEDLTPVVGLQCGAFAFSWSCGVSLSASGGGSSTKTDGNGCGTFTANIDGLMVREQMLHEDPETPWLCKPSMTSLHFAAWVGNTRLLPQLVRVKGFSPDEPDDDGWTALHFAALAGQVAAVEGLLAHSCSSDKKTKSGSTPMLLAAKYGRSPDHVAIVRQLAAAGAAADVRDARGRTLLMLAAKSGNLAMVQLLLELGLDPSATDCQDREAQQYAGQHAAIFRLLRSAQATQRAGSRKRQAKRQQRPPLAPLPDGQIAHLISAAGDYTEGSSGDSSEESSETESNGPDAGDGGGNGRGRREDVQHLPLLAEKWRVGAGQLVRGRLIEQGAFGAVFEGTWCGARVAIKQVARPIGRGAVSGSEPLAELEASSLEREVAILTALPPHERIARMLGSVELPGEGVCLVMAFYPHTLQAIMQSERLRRSWLTPLRRAAIARQLAEGLAFLHGLPGPRVIHRDLKPNNVLLEAAPSLGVKICDFGLSRILASNDVQSSSGAGHAFWMAPELLRALPYDEKVDVYSYGVILYQLAYWIDNQLYGGLNKAQVDFQVVHGILRLQDRLPGGIDSVVHALVRECLDEDPQKRPSMAQVLERLASVRELSQPSQQGAGGQLETEIDFKAPPHQHAQAVQV